MKRYLLSIAAVAATALLFAFSNASKANQPFANSFFEFDYAHYNPTQANVEDESKWIKVADLGSCNNTAVKACRIEVLSAYVSGSSLLSTANLVAAESSQDIAYVISGNTVNTRNKN
jgi:hypothetical protein